MKANIWKTTKKLKILLIIRMSYRGNKGKGVELTKSFIGLLFTEFPPTVQRAKEEGS